MFERNRVDGASPGGRIVLVTMELRICGLGGSVLPVGALDIQLQTEAGSKFLAAVPVFEHLPTDVVLGVDYLLSGDVQLVIEGGGVFLRPSVSASTATAVTTGEPDGLTTLSSVLERHKAIFAESTSQLPGTGLLEHRIPTDGHAPISIPLRRYAERERVVIAEQVQEMRAAGVIRPSSSPLAAPVVLVRKKNGFVSTIGS
uniref:Tick transposon n=1 Tax=Rhipicephalus appendiculatus TaxID=34631 RepID=A0A131YH31_RHIAP